MTEKRAKVAPKLKGSLLLKKKLATVLLFVIAALCITHLIQTDFSGEEGSRIKAGLVQEGRLGRLLKENGYLKLADEDYLDGGRKQCRQTKNIPAPLPRYRYTAVLTIFSKIRQHMKVSLGSGFDFEKYATKFVIGEGTHTYKVGLTGPDADISTMRIWVGEDYEAVVVDVRLDGYVFPHTPVYVRHPKLLREGAILELGSGSLIDFEGFPDAILIGGSAPYVDLSVPESFNSPGYQHSFFQRSRKPGACGYQAFEPLAERLWEHETHYIAGVKSVHLKLNDQYLNGPLGLLQNKELKGSITEKPGSFTVFDGRGFQNYPIGVRFHGGGPGRKKELESFRIYFREEDKQPEGFFAFGQGEVRTIVLKYTKIARTQSITDSNPFSHAFALDVGRALGALVPRSELVNLHVNNEYKGLYLAMDYFSERSFDKWLNGNQYTAYIYKRGNSTHASYIMRYLYGQILHAKGEETLRIARQFIDMDNLLNSMLLSAYIGDDDYCQGVDIVSTSDTNEHELTIVNWDLDHGFTIIRDERLETMAPWQLTSVFPITLDSRLCPRMSVMQHLYKESAEFRQMYRARFEKAFSSTLTAANLNRAFAKYRRINEQMDNRYQPAIDSIDEFIVRREAFMRQQLESVENGISQEN